MFLLYIVAYLDRANIAFARLTMLGDLRFSEAVFGFGAGIFYLGYVLFEIPGALAVERGSARRWLSRMLLTWGACALLLGIIHTAPEFIGARFLLGAAEAGFFPGIVVYLSHWFPQRYRGRALAGFILAIPLSLSIGAPISAVFLGVHWFGIPGWRWVFIAEAVPAIVLGSITPFYLRDRPCDARWLAEDEREWLEGELEIERRAKPREITMWSAIRRSDVLCLAVALFLSNAATVVFLLWMPATIAAASALGPRASAALSAMPFLAATAAVAISGRFADSGGDRRTCTMVPMIAAAAGFGCVAMLRKPLPLLIGLLCLTCAALFAWAPAFWTLPTEVLGESAAAAAVAFINSVGNLGGFAGPSIAGMMLSRGQSTAATMLLASCCMLGAALLVGISTGGRRAPAFIAESHRCLEGEQP